MRETGGEPGVLFEGNLAFAIDLAASRLVSKGRGELARRAAVLARAIITGHPFVDGNKRTGMACIDLVLQRNGNRLVVSNEEGTEFALRVARGEVSLEELASWIEDHTRKLDARRGLP